MKRVLKIAGLVLLLPVLGVVALFVSMFAGNPEIPDGQERVTRALKDGETLQVGNLSIRVFSIPGHTRGSAAYLVNGVLFLGDSADATKEGKLVTARWLVTGSVEQNRASLKALAARLKPEEVKQLVFSHTGVLPGYAPLRDFAAH